MDAPDKAAATFIGRTLVASEFFCYLDDDDELLPGALARRIDIMREHPQYDCVATNGYYVQGNITRLLFEQARLLQESGYVQSLLDARNWLASCGGLFRTSTVKMSYFQNLPRHREWTVIAFRIASSLNVHFEDITTFRVNSSPNSQSKKDSYVDASVDIFEDLRRCTKDQQHISIIRHRQAAAYRGMCSYYRLRRNFPAAWRAYWNAVRSARGWSYIPYAVLLLLRCAQPCPELVQSYVNLVQRVTRNPRKYLRITWWKPLLRLAFIRASAACLHTLPSLMRALRRPRGKILVFPLRMNRYQPAESYLAWKVFAACDLRICGPEVTDADVAIAWNPVTTYTPDDELLGTVSSHVTVLNGRCTDVRKSVVDRHFREVFGYGLEIDPRTYSGPILRKSEKNGTHDAKVLQGPLEQTDPGYVYQRLVSYETALGMLEWRVLIAGKKPVAVYRLYGPLNDRFSYWSEHAEITTLEEAFSERERAKIAEFCDAMGLDFGALDVLRERSDGKLYVCDCNPTPTGPSQVLSVFDQLRIVKQVAAAFRREYLSACSPLRATASAIPAQEPAR